MQDIFLDRPNGVKWSTLNLSEKYHLKQRFFNGDGVSDSEEISMNCRNQLKAMGFKKTFCPTHGKKFRVTIPIIKTFLKKIITMQTIIYLECTTELSRMIPHYQSPLICIWTKIILRNY